MWTKEARVVGGAACKPIQSAVVLAKDAEMAAAFEAVQGARASVSGTQRNRQRKGKCRSARKNGEEPDTAQQRWATSIQAARAVVIALASNAKASSLMAMTSLTTPSPQAATAEAQRVVETKMPEV
jgi:hypothetical protein